jgi:hypothetical protein
MPKLLDYLAPFQVIARELTALRELYEAELAEKHIYRVTEAPGKSDTEILWGDEDVKPKSVLKRILEGLEPEDDED